ncbi:MAG TPA: ABC transporter transmembrane domain-containing protein [Mobilitalea sp.]|nr:ABC transporter transmembrane domain-containing protein [Mobilitalea sp.]
MSLFKKMIINRIGLVVLTIGFSVLSIVISLYWNTQLSFIINTFNHKNNVSVQMIVTAALTMLVSAGIAFAMGMCSSWTCETMAHDLRMGYVKHFSIMSITEIENINAGEHLSKLQNEISEVSGYLRSNLFYIMDDLIRFTGTLIWMLVLNPKLTLLANAPVIVLLWYTVFSSRIISGAAQQSQQSNMHMNGFTDTLITIFPIIRLFNASNLIQKKYCAVLDQWEAASIIEERKRAKLMSLSAFLSTFPLVLLFLVGGLQVIRGETTLGTLYVFINLSENVSGVMMNMPGRIAGLRRFAVNVKRLQPSVLLTDRRRFNEYTY